MSVNPGWSAQKFINGTLDKLARMRASLPTTWRWRSTGASTARPPLRACRLERTCWSPPAALFGTGDPAQAYADLVG